MIGVISFLLFSQKDRPYGISIQVTEQNVEIRK
jgi:hypothetical protein